MGQQRLTCMAQGHGDAWEAICLDLDIAVQGESFNDVKRALEDAIASYLEAARREDPQTRQRLLARRAPLSVRAGYWFRFALFSARKIWGGNNDRRTEIIRHCPAYP